MNYKIWNKTDAINNANAEYIINSLQIKENDEVILIIDDLGEVCAIELERIIKSVYGLDNCSNVDEVATEYIKILEKQPQAEVPALEEQENRLAALEDKVIQLQEALTTFLTSLSSK